MAQILVFGDSIAAGAWTDEGGWVNLLQKYWYKKRLEDQDNYFLIYNLGISGDTTQELLARFEKETKARLDEEAENIIIFAIGINDVQWVNDEKHTRLSKEEFTDNLEKLIELARGYSTKIIFLGLTPVDEAKVDPIPWIPELSYKNEHIKQFNQLIRTVCQENSLYFIDIFENWIKLDYQKLLFDGAHPNTKGHKRIFEKVKTFLRGNKII